MTPFGIALKNCPTFVSWTHLGPVGFCRWTCSRTAACSKFAGESRDPKQFQLGKGSPVHTSADVRKLLCLASEASSDFLTICFWRFPHTLHSAHDFAGILAWPSWSISARYSGHAGEPSGKLTVSPHDMKQMKQTWFISSPWMHKHQRIPYSNAYVWCSLLCRYTHLYIYDK